MYDDIEVTRLARAYDFDESQLYIVYDYVGSNNLLGCLLNLCSLTPSPHESLDRLVDHLEEDGVNRFKLEEYFNQLQEFVYEEPKNFLDCKGEVDDRFDHRRIEWFYQASRRDE